MKLGNDLQPQGVQNKPTLMLMKHPASWVPGGENSVSSETSKRCFALGSTFQGTIPTLSHCPPLQCLLVVFSVFFLNSNKAECGSIQFMYLVSLSRLWPQSQPAVQQTLANGHEWCQEESKDGSLQIQHCCQKKPTEITRVDQCSHFQLGGTISGWSLDIITNQFCTLSSIELWGFFPLLIALSANVMNFNFCQGKKEDFHQKSHFRMLS